MSNLYIESLADRYGDLDRQIKEIEDEKKAIREKLIAEIGDVPVVGLRWTVTKTESNRTDLDKKAVREFLGDKAEEFETTSKITALRVKQTKVFGKVYEEVA